MKSMKWMAALVVAGGIALGGSLSSTTAFAADPDKGKSTDSGKKDKDKKTETKSEGGVAIGGTAPAFTLTDTDGKTVSLSDFKGKIVVLEWFNPECPWIVLHHKTNHTFNQLHDEYASKDVVLLCINSSGEGKQGYGKDKNKQKREEFKMSYPVLLDENSTVATAYGAKTTPHVFIIDKEGKLAYKGGIDNGTTPNKVGDTNYAKAALDEMIAGKPVSKTETPSKGCSVKFADKK